MRKIVKLGEPHELKNWKRENRKTPDNLHYSGGGFPRDAVRKALLKEQYYLCAYTMKPLPSPQACHIEHVIAQSRGTKGIEDIDYENMLACYPSSDVGLACQYGAVYKADYDILSRPFVSPLNPAVEHAFRYREDGTVDGLTVEAKATEKALNLNFAALRNDREATLKGLLCPRGRPLSAAKARRLAAEVMKPDEQGHLRAFCVAISQVALSYAERAERRAARLRSGVHPDR